MGLAASQARLLLLTARKSDLEYRAQIVSQRKLTLAMETEGIAKAYSAAMNNTTLMIKMYTDFENPDSKEPTPQEVTYDNLCNASTGYRLIWAATGQPVIPSADADVSYVVNDDAYLMKNGSKYTFEGTEYTVEEGGVVNTGTKEAPNWVVAYDSAAYEQAMKDYRAGAKVLPAINNKQFLHQALQSGQIIIEKCTSTTKQINNYENGPDDDKKKVVKSSWTWEAVSLAGMSEISQGYDNSDDKAAESTYQYESLRVQTKDKQLDVELKQIETQQKACESELEAVKKVIQGNIEKSFKYFT